MDLLSDKLFTVLIAIPCFSSRRVSIDSRVWNRNVDDWLFRQCMQKNPVCTPARSGLKTPQPFTHVLWTQYCIDSLSLRSATHDLRSQLEFLFTCTSHVFKNCICTQLHFHWIERGNVSSVTVITEQLKHDWLELFTLYNVHVVFQNSFV